MSTVAKIKAVHLYVGLTEDAQKCYEMKKYLEDNGIPFVLLPYFDKPDIEEVFKGLNTWAWGENLETKTFTRFPLVHWTTFYDDFDSILECAQSVEELATSSLVKYKQLA